MPIGRSRNPFGPGRFGPIRLGHAQPTTTLNVYGDWFPKPSKPAIDIGRFEQ